MQLSVYKWGFWVRVAGKGLRMEWDRPALFSERYGYTRVRRWWKLSFQILPRMT